jgi:hypothetical protein
MAGTAWLQSLAAVTDVAGFLVPSLGAYATQVRVATCYMYFYIAMYTVVV